MKQQILPLKAGTLTCRLARLMPSFPFEKESQRHRNSMTDQSPLPSSEDIWDELLNSEASNKFLDEQVKKAGELLKQDQS
jgi:hypothetical protein